MKPVFIIIAIVIGITGAFFLFQRYSKTPLTFTRNQTPTTQATSQGFCTTSQLSGTVDPSPGAGNVYATVTITNISNTSCQIIGNNTLSINYPNSVTNFQVTPQGTPTTAKFNLEPNQSIYSLIHYPNGPQCSSQITGVDAGVSYTISQTETLALTPTNASTLEIPSCANPSEITTIDVYPFSITQVTP